MTVRTPAPYFVSYAQFDTAIVGDLLRRLVPNLAASRRYEFAKWQDTDLLVGEGWNAAIQQALAGHRIALLMLTPTFLIRPYVVSEELPRLLVPGKLVLPVLVSSIDLQRQDAHGIEALQIFATRVGGMRRPYSQCNTKQREAFALELYQAIEARLARDL